MPLRSRRLPSSGLAIALALLIALPAMAVAAGAPSPAPASAAASSEAASAPAIVVIPPPSDARPRKVEPADAQAQCEAAVGRSIRDTRGKAVVGGIQFSNDSRAARADGGQLEVQGTGHYLRTGNANVAFRYRCVVDEAGGTEPGVMFHETEPGAAPALPVWQADLSQISPSACEAAAASSLQSRHPRASGIAFDSRTRKLEPAGDGGTALTGSGRIVRSPGAPESIFRYRCVFDTMGALGSARTTD
jgi:hypothetical protein